MPTLSQKSLSQGPYGGEPGALFKHDGRLFYSAAARATVITSVLLNNWKVNHSIFFLPFLSCNCLEWAKVLKEKKDHQTPLGSWWSAVAFESLPEIEF